MSAVSRVSTSLDTPDSLLAEYAGTGNLDDIIPTLSKDLRAMRRIEGVAQNRPTSHEIVLGDCRSASALSPHSVQLVVTSPPYWNLKRYNDHKSQLWHFDDY